MAAGTAVLLSNVAIAPAFADSLSPEIEPETQYQIVLPEGEMMTDAELAEVEGEWVHVAAGAAVGVGFKYAECQLSGQQCGWQDYAISGAEGAVTAMLPGAAARSGVRFFRNGQKIRGIRVFVR